MTVQALPAYLREHWPTIRAALLEGTYQPQRVRRVVGSDVLGLPLRLPSGTLGASGRGARAVPADFDTMAADEIADLFEGNVE
jgi:hypothetical protein